MKKKELPASFVPFYSNVFNIGSITDHFHYSSSATFNIICRTCLIYNNNYYNNNKKMKIKMQPLAV